MTAARARIGYTSVAYVTEIFPKLFYEVAPPGVVLQILTQQVTSHGTDDLDRLHAEARAAVASFARAGADMVILGGAPTNLSGGPDALRAALETLSREAGIPVSSSATAQMKALAAVGAQKIGIVHPAPAGRDAAQMEKLREAGFDPVASAGAGAGFEDYNRIPDHMALRLGRDLIETHPEIDTLLYSCPHWPVAGAIEPLEADCDVTVVTSFHAIVWEGLRVCGIDDRIPGQGKLLREW